MSHARKQRIDWNAVKDKLRAAQTVREGSSTIDDPSIQEIFRSRAERLSASNIQIHSKAKTTPVLVFRVDNETYGIELRNVAQVFSDTGITPVPGAPESLIGVANLQGEVRSVFGLRQLLSLSGGDEETSRYILLLRQDTRRVGLQVERIDSVQLVALDELIDHENTSAEKRADYVHGVTRDNVIVLQADKLFEVL